MKLLVVSILSVCLAGCYPTLIHKTITVEKDPQGKIIKILEVEEVTQNLSYDRLFILDHLKVANDSSYMPHHSQ